MSAPTLRAQIEAAVELLEKATPGEVDADELEPGEWGLWVEDRIGNGNIALWESDKVATEVDAKLYAALKNLAPRVLPLALEALDARQRAAPVPSAPPSDEKED